MGRYGDYIQHEAQHAIDAWIDDSQLAATSLADFLQDLIMPSANTMGTCVAAEANSNVFTLVPLPSEHYQICSKTSLCQLRCADAFTLFYYEFNRTAVHSVAEPFAYDVSAESPFFNAYESASTDSLYFVDQHIVALATRNQTLHPACRPCIAGCLSIVKTPWTGTAATTSFSVKTYCIPPPEALQV